MFYEVLINYCCPDNHIDEWSAFTNFPTYSSVIFKFKREINSIFDFVYIRKCFQSEPGTYKTNFKLVTKMSYTFRHYPSIDNSTNKYLNSLFYKSLMSIDKKNNQISEVVNDKSKEKTGKS